MATPIQRSNHPNAYWPGMHAWFGRSYNEKAQIWSTIFETRKSKRAHEEMAELSGFGLAALKSEGDGVMFDTELEGYKQRFTHVTIALAFAITEEAKEDNQYAEIGNRRSKLLGRSMRLTKEILAHRILNEAFDPTVVGGDGSALCAADHAVFGGTQSNIMAVPADLSEIALEDACVQTMLMRDNRGHLINLQPRSLIIHSSNEFEAARILNSQLQSNTDGNNINVIKAKGKIPKVVTTPYLLDPDAFFVMNDAPEGLIQFQRRALAYAQDKDFNTGNDRFKASERYSFGYGDWRCLVGSPGA
jgi:hypothetical protein